LVARLVLTAILVVNSAWAADLHVPGTDGVGALLAGAIHGDDGPGADSHDGHDHGAGHDHCLHCYGGGVQQPTVDFRGPQMASPVTDTLLPAPDPDRPRSRSTLPPERPPRR
jgi:hypothetical protein